MMHNHNETSNPALRGGHFYRARAHAEAMSVGGVVTKTTILLAIAMATAGYVWHDFLIAKHTDYFLYYLAGGSITAFVLALLTIYNNAWAPITAPLYAVAEGVALGSFSLFFEHRYPGIVMQALPLTFTILATMLLFYRMGLITVNQRFRSMMLIAMSSIALLYAIGYILRLIGFNMLPLLHDSSMMGIVFNLFVLAIATLGLLLDFDFIDRAVHRGAPKHMEWYAAFSLLVSLVWIYMEVLKLLGRMRRR